MSVIGDAVIRVRAETSGVKSQIEKDVHSPLAAIGKTVAAVAVGGAVVGFMKGAVEGAAAAQARTDRLQTSLKNLGISYAATSNQIGNYVTKESMASAFAKGDLTESFTRVVTATHNVGQAMNITSTAADLARGRNISLEAATNLLVKVHNGQVGALTRMGIAYQKVTPNVDALKLKMQQYKDAEKSASASQKAHLEGLIAVAKGHMAAAKAADLQANGVAALAQVHKTYADQAKKYGESAEGSLARAKNAFTSIQVAIGQVLLPVIATFASKGAQLLEAFRAHWPQIKQAVEDAIKPLEPTFDKVKDALRQIGDAIGDAAKRFMEMRGHGAAIVAALATVAAGIVVVTGAVIAMNLAFLANPVVLVIVALAALAAALTLAYKNSATFRTVVNDAFTVIKTIVLGVLDAIKSAITSWVATATAIWKTWGGVITTTVVAAWNIVKTQVQGAVQVLQGVFNIIKGLLTGNWSEMWQGAQQVFSGVITSIVGLMENLPSLLLPLALKAAEEVAKGLLQITIFLVTLPGRIVQFFATLLANLATSVVGAAEDVGKAVINGIISGVENALPSLASKLGDVAKSIPSGIGHLLGISSPSTVMAEKVGKPIAQGVIQGWIEGIVPLPQKMSQSLRDAITKLQARAQEAQNALSKAFSDMANRAMQAFDARTQQKLDASTRKWDAYAKAISDNAQKAADALTGQMGDAIKAIDGQLSTTIATIDAAKGTLTPAEQSLKDMEDAHAAAQRTQAEADARTALAKANLSGDATQITAAQKALDDALYAENVASLQAQAALERKAADDAADAAKQAAQKQHDQDVQDTKDHYDKLQAIADKATQDAQAANEKARAKDQLNLQSRRQYAKDNLQAQLDDMAASLAKHPGMWAKMHAEVLKMFHSDFGPKMRTAGANLGDMFGQGMRDSFDGVAVVASQLAAIVSAHLRVKSPTEKGPMSDLDKWWEKLPATLASGVNPAELKRVTDGITAPPFSQTTSGAAAAAWDEDVFIRKLAEAIAGVVPAPHVGVNVTGAAATDIDSQARVARR
jgi:phage-related protein